MVSTLITVSICHRLLGACLHITHKYVLELIHLFNYHTIIWWLGSRVVSVLDSGTEGLGFNFATLSGNSLRQTVHTHCASVHQAAKLVAALLRVAWVTVGLAESNGSLPPGL